MRHLYWSALVVLSMSSVTTAHAGAPRWCDGYRPSLADSNAKSVKSALRTSDFSFRTLVSMAQAACDKQGDPERERLFAEWRTEYQKVSAATDADFDELMGYVMKPHSERNKLEQQQCDPIQPSTKLDADRDAEIEAVANLVRCTGKRSQRDVRWWLDRPEVTQVQRVAIIDRCITERAVAEDRLGGEFAICWGDLGKLDRARFDKELAALKLNEHGRVMAVATFGEAKVRADRYVAKYKKLAAKDPSWKRLLDAAQAGWDGWYKLREQHRATYDVIDAFREKLATGSKQEVAGCDPPLRKLLFAQMASKKPASIDDTNAAAKESPGYDIAVALRRCYSAQGKALEAATLHEIFFTRGTRDRRGPRSGSYYATLDALNAIREDRESFALSKLPYLPTGKDEKIHTPGEVATNQVEHGVAQGQIAKVSRGKVTTTVSFKTVRWRDPTYDCTQSNRIERFDDHGTAIYQQDCKLTGYENKTSTEAPVDVPTEFADGLKPGQMAILHLDTRNKKRAGIPVGVFADANKKKLLGLFGVFW